MGYRSEVGLCLTSNAKQKLADALESLQETNNENYKIVNSLFDGAVKREDKESGAVAYYWDAVKWYPDYEDVGFIEAFIRDLADIDDYYFLRIGEDNDDTECGGGYWENPFCMNLLRTINFDDFDAKNAETVAA